MFTKKPKHTDLSHLEHSGSRCVGCGLGVKEGVPLKRLRTYSRSLCCIGCYFKYASCENVNPVGTKCHHDPTDHQNKTGICKIAGCGCPAWRHGLEDEFDKQLAAGVGRFEQFRHCESYGVNLGKCGRIILAGPDRTISRLCNQCEKRWVQETSQGAREVGALLDMDVTKVVPS